MTKYTRIRPPASSTKIKSARKRADTAQDEIERLKRVVDDAYAEEQTLMSRCKHVATPGTENNYATYCKKCGYMMDTWL